MTRTGAVTAMTFLIAAGLAPFAPPAHADATTRGSVIEIAAGQTKQAAGAQIHFLRGGFGGTFSHGLDDIAATLGRAGIKAQVTGWSSADSVAARIRQARATNRQAGPVILAGHSLGAGAVIDIARQLTAAGVPVDLVIVFDTLGAPPVPKGVARFISFKASGDKSKAGSFKGAPGFTGQIVNVDIRTEPSMADSSHWDMLDKKGLQARVVREVETAVRRWKARRQS